MGSRTMSRSLEVKADLIIFLFMCTTHRKT
jgi:hypothetical protein